VARGVACCTAVLSKERETERQLSRDYTLGKAFHVPYHVNAVEMLLPADHTGGTASRIAGRRIGTIIRVLRPSILLLETTFIHRMQP